jgi:hypothetical protein
MLEAFIVNRKARKAVLVLAIILLVSLACTVDIPGFTIDIPSLDFNDGNVSSSGTQTSVKLTPTLAPKAITTEGDVYYVHPEGGDWKQCNGLAPYPYPGVGENQNCAWDHPFRALPPGGEARIAGGDVLIITSGSYMMGYGAPGANDLDVCDIDYTWDCVMPPVPSGEDPANPTRILGYGWDTGCKNPPELWGNERAGLVLNLTGVENVIVGCLEITDHSSCVEDHSGDIECNKDKFPYGKWAATGIYSQDASNVYLFDLDIHGMAYAGVKAGRLENWTVENVQLTANGWVGWDGDIEGEDANKGTLVFRYWMVEWNGCGESWPDGEPIGCWGQSAGGYGDGVGTGETEGRWVIEDSAFVSNTSDGLDLLYARPGSSIEIYRTVAMGNAGDQIKTSGPTLIENVVVVSNCGFFDGGRYTYDVDSCRAGGSALAFTLWEGDQVSVWNSTIVGQGDCLTIAECGRDGECDGSELVFMRNNIFVGGNEYHSSDTTCLYWFGEDGLPEDPYDIDYSLIFDVKNVPPCPGSHDLCDVPPGVTNPLINSFDYRLLVNSSAINAGLSQGAPLVDIEGEERDSRPDIGADER